ncbi:hypothetical protein [Clostridium perfringens]|uniref:Uncharacterized protein n=1 Tax=Clostridium perfringens (strain 13 / Type A) TaxID=195102 RepID=Q8XMM7_CLOPE|nr:hypothetical protein [Clostridium perfringens]BAB80367.1 hypothetical protein [Clostridium perfringens str. 13]
MKKFFIMVLSIIVIVGGVLFYRFKTRKFLNFNLESISIEQATESDFRNSPSKDNKNEEPLDYFDIVFSIRAKNTSKNLCTDNIVPHIILPKELKSNGYIDIGLNPLSSTDEIILPGHEKGFPYKLFVKKGKYLKEELLKFLRECKFKVNIVSFKKTKLQFLTYGGSVDYIE